MDRSSRRLIPARAGKTPCLRARSARKKAHPRVCRENFDRFTGDRESVGSSPRVRGKPSARAAVMVPRGLIPACAGKTPTTFVLADASRAHPRVCGENSVCFDSHTPDQGSSPRVRGKQGLITCGRPRRRLIPACAGKTFRSRLACSDLGAHPRVCGENNFSAINFP